MREESGLGAEAPGKARAFPAGTAGCPEPGSTWLGSWRPWRPTFASAGWALGLQAGGSERSEGFPVCQQLHFAEIAGGRAQGALAGQSLPSSQPRPGAPSSPRPSPVAAAGQRRSARATADPRLLEDTPDWGRKRCRSREGSRAGSGQARPSPPAERPGA